MKSFNFNLLTASVVSCLVLSTSTAFAAASAGGLSNSSSSGSSTVTQPKPTTPEPQPDQSKTTGSTSSTTVSETTISESWWLNWDAVTSSKALMTEGHSCATLAQTRTISRLQQDILVSNCEEIAFYDSFDTEEGNGFKTLTGKKPVVAVPYGSFKKWNSYSQGAMLLKHNSPWVQAGSDGDGYSAALSTIHGSSKIETRGPITLEEGDYVLMFKLKASTQKLLPKYVGVTTVVSGGHTNIKHHSYVPSYYTNSSWDTVAIPIRVDYEDNIVLSIEDIFNGMKDRGSVVDDILIVKNINPISTN